jgi:heptosyltransferase-3
MKTIALNTESPKILIIKLKHIGDVLMATPAISALRERFPNAYISMLVTKGTEEMITGNPKIDEVIVFNRFRESTLTQRIIKEIGFAFGIRKRKFDLIIELGFGDREAIYGLISGAKLRIGFDPEGKGFIGREYTLTHRISMDNSKHIVDRDMELVNLLGVSNRKRELELYYSSEDREFAERILSENEINDDDLVVIVHPTSRWLFKCWTVEGNAKVADYLERRSGAKVIITSGPDIREIEKAEKIIGLMETRPISILGTLTLKQLAALIDRAGLFIGIDSAPMHMAAALKTPVIAFFGPSGEHNWGPWGEGHNIIKKDMPCMPCGKAGCNDSKRSECLEAITVKDVIPFLEDKISEIIDRKRGKAGSSILKNMKESRNITKSQKAKMTEV